MGVLCGRARVYAVRDQRRGLVLEGASFYGPLACVAQTSSLLQMSRLEACATSGGALAATLSGVMLALGVALLGGVVEQLAHLSGLPHLAGPCS